MGRIKHILQQRQVVSYCCLQGGRPGHCSCRHGTLSVALALNACVIASVCQPLLSLLRGKTSYSRRYVLRPCTC